MANTMRLSLGQVHEIISLARNLWEEVLKGSHMSHDHMTNRLVNAACLTSTNSPATTPDEQLYKEVCIVCREVWNELRASLLIANCSTDLGHTTKMVYQRSQEQLDKYQLLDGDKNPPVTNKITPEEEEFQREARISLTVYDKRDRNPAYDGPMGVLAE